jgi:hypothetical protein
MNRKFYVVSNVHFIVSLNNQQMRKIFGKCKIYFQPLHMFRQIDCHPQGVHIKELQCYLHQNIQYTVSQ